MFSSVSHWCCNLKVTVFNLIPNSFFLFFKKAYFTTNFTQCWLYYQTKHIIPLYYNVNVLVCKCNTKEEKLYLPTKKLYHLF